MEDWGGEIISVEVSATKKQNLEKLLDSILAVSELLELKNLPDAELEAIIIESKKDRKRGVVVSAIPKTGTLKVSDQITASGKQAKVKLIVDDKGNNLKEAKPGTPVEILGFKEVPNVGDLILEKGSELENLSLDADREEIIGKDTKQSETYELPISP